VARYPAVPDGEIASPLGPILAMRCDSASPSFVSAASRGRYLPLIDVGTTMRREVFECSHLLVGFVRDRAKLLKLRKLDFL